MGREIKRVALDFVFPLGETWTGYLNPHYSEHVQCPACGGDGASPAGRLLSSLWYEHLHAGAADILARHADTLPPALVAFAYTVLGRSVTLARVEHHRGGWSYHLEECDVDALLAADRLWDFTRVPRTDEQREIVRAKVAAGGNSWLPTSNGYRPSAAEVNAWQRRGMGHDSINSWACIVARAKTYEVETGCPACDGNGHVPNAELEARIEAWTRTEPPAGEGWQLWQTVSEGGPVSPVFVSPEDLARWISTPGPEWGRASTTYETALKWITESGWAPSAMMIGEQMVDPMAATC